MEQIEIAVIGGGQSGLAAAHALRTHGSAPVVLEASEEPVGSWPRYYDSLTLFSPARYSSLPGMAFDGDPDRYPRRDDVVAYLRRYADRLDSEVRTGARVSEVRPDGDGFRITLNDGDALWARAVVAASGSFGRPHCPRMPGLETFTGTLLHVSDYRRPESFAGQRVVVVGAGNSAVQIAAELAAHARTTLTSRAPAKFARQRILGRDLHFWLARSGVDTAPLGRFVRTPPTQLVIDDGRYHTALAAGAPDRRAMFTAVEDRKVFWADGTAEEVDTILPATGYRPDLGYLAPVPGALDAHGLPRHRDGASSARPDLAYVGLEWQRSLSSNSLRGVGRDAERMARRLAARTGRL